MVYVNPLKPMQAQKTESTCFDMSCATNKNKPVGSVGNLDSSGALCEMYIPRAANEMAHSAKFAIVRCPAPPHSASKQLYNFYVFIGAT